MTTLTAGDSASFILQAGVGLVVEAGADTVGTVQFDRASEDSEQGFTARVRSRGYGPFSVPVSVSIEVE